MRQIPYLLLLAICLANCGAQDNAILTPTPAASGCADRVPAPAAVASGPPATPQPTAAPAPTVAPPSPAPTDLAAASAPTSFPSDLLAATSVVQATVMPFPTAGAGVVQLGQPATAQAVRGDLSLSVALPSDHFLAGEAAQVRLTLRNDGAESLFVAGDGRELGWLALRDERGDESEAWPWRPANWPGAGYLLPLAPGQTISATLTLQTPPEDIARGHSYALWAATRIARGVPGTDGPDNLWLHVEAGPILLTLAPPTPEQRLHAELTTDRGGWRLHASDPAGRRLPASAWGVLEAALTSTRGSGGAVRTLAPSADGIWSASWSYTSAPGLVSSVIRAWVAAPGYVTATIVQAIPSEQPLSAADLAQRFSTGPEQCRQIFSDLAAAQVALRTPLAQAPALPAGTAFHAILTEWVDRETTIHSQYDLPGGAWLELTQRVTAEQYEGAGWGEARYDPEARQLAVGTTTGYLVRRYGTWVLDWKIGTIGFELHAPDEALTAEELAGIAASVQSMP